MPQVLNFEQFFTKEENAKAEECAIKVREILASYGCKMLSPLFQTHDGKWSTEIHILPIRKVVAPDAKLVVPEGQTPDLSFLGKVGV
jgi:hypothetical protein